jgi:hypothetical protein
MKTPMARVLAVLFGASLVLGGTLPVAASSTLDDACVVSILNRTVTVKSDGSWVLPNIPANIGRVRARATCVRDGITTSGQSDYFVVPPNGVVNNVPPIVFDAPAPIPAKVTISAPQLALVGAGVTTQLTTTATMPDGSTVDISSAASGTNYTTSNAAIATVSADGLVTAVASGAVLITALNDGAVGMLRLTTRLSADSDGDGIPDDYELAHGLNPNDPTDALEDPDHDGLTNLQEYQLGTDPHNPDTDGDGLPDGLEVKKGTNPLLYDTDGGGIGDGLEVQAGTNPLDPSDDNLAIAKSLASLEAQPGTLVIYMNTLLGEGSVQVKIIGHLIDGHTIDLTSTARGTNYASSDLNIVNFGGVPGQVFGGQGGSATVTVTNGGFSVVVPVVVNAFAPKALSFVSLPGYANDVDVVGNFAFVAAGSAGLQVVDVTDKHAPSIVGSLALPGNADDVRASAGVVYVAAESAGLISVDASDPTAPKILGSVAVPGGAQSLVVKGPLAYVGTSTGLSVVDVSNPATALVLGSYATPGLVRGLDVNGGIAVLACASIPAGGSGIMTVNIADPSNIYTVGKLATTNAQDVVSDGKTAFVADYTGSLATVDITNPANPVLLARENGQLGGYLLDLAKVGSFTFGADVVFVNGVPISNVTVPSNPQVATRLDFPMRDDNGMGIAADGEYVYLVTAQFGLTRPGTIVGDSRLYIGQYLQIIDTAGIPPTVTITQPAAGTSIVAGRAVTVHAEATDDFGVAAVTFSVNGIPAVTVQSAPFEFIYTVPADATSVTFGATAVDFGSNTSQPVSATYSVHPDVPPIVSITAPDPSSAPLERTTIAISANASDPDGQVAKVQFAVNGTVIRTVTAPPYQASYTVPTGAGSLQIVARAIDDGGLSADASLTIPVTFNPAPPSPDPSLILAELPTNGASAVVGQPGAVMSTASLQATNTASGAQVTVAPNADGSFVFSIPASPGDMLSLIAISSAGYQSPATQIQVSGLPIGMKLWLRADKGVVTDSNNVVSSWQDQSGNGNNSVPPTAAAQPNWVDAVANNLPVVRFDGSANSGSGQSVNFTQRLAGNIRTVFWVVSESASATAAYRPLLGDATNNNDFAGEYGAPGPIWRACCASPRVIGGRTRLNGVPVDGTNTPRPQTLSLISLATTDVVSADRFGTDPGYGPWWGDLAELIIYDRPLSATEFQAVENYLTAKYAIGGVVTTPRVTPAGGLFTGTTIVSMADWTPGSDIHYTTDGSDPTPSSTLYATPLTLTQSTTIKARAFASGLADSAIVTVGFTNRTDFNPATVPNLQLWLRADAGAPTAGGDFWADQSGQGNDGSSNRAPRLVEDVVNGLPAMRFDGSANNGAGQSVNLTQRLAGNIRTVFWVVSESASATAAYRALLGDASNNNDFAGEYGAPGPIWRSCCTSPRVIGGQTRLNGQPINGTTTARPHAMSVISLVTTDVVSADRFGNDPGYGPWWGDLSELVVYDRALTDTEVRDIEAYLINKYDITPSATAPVASSTGGTFTGSTTLTLTSGCGEIHYTLDGSDPSQSSPLYTGPITITQTTTVKSRTFCPNLTPSDITTIGFTSSTDFSPAGLPNLRLWLRADAGVPSGAGDFWADQSGQGNNAVQLSSASTPLLVQDAANGLPVMRFDGSVSGGQFVNFTQRLAGNIRTVFWVVSESASATAAYRSLLGDVSSNNDFAGEYGAPGPIWRPCCASTQVIGGITRLNGAPIDGTRMARPQALSVISVVTTGGVSADRFGADPGYSPWWGDLAELVIYDRPLTGTEIQAVENYLLAKYRINNTVTNPVVTPVGGLFTNSVTVTMTDQTPGAEIRYTLDGSDPTSTSTLYAQPFTLAQSTTVKAKAFATGWSESSMVTVGFTSSADFNPASIPGSNLLLWLRADAGDPTGAGDLWSDQSGHGNDASSNRGPILVQDVANGLPAMRFDGSASAGSGQLVNFKQRLGGNIRTVFWVVSESAAATAAYRSLLGDSSSNNDFAGEYGAPGSIWRSCCTSPRVIGGHTRLNGAPVDGTITSRPRNISVISLVTTDVVSADRFGNDPGYSPWWGDLAELVVYSRALTDAEVQQVEAHLMNKYGLATSAGVPTTSSPGGMFTGSTSVSLSSATPCSEIHYTLDGSDPTQSSPLYAGPITITQTTAIKTRSFCPGLSPSDIATFGFTSSTDVSPLSIPGGNLLLWLRADAGVPNLNFGDFWGDQSGNGNNATQTSTLATPHLVQDVANGLPAMRFDGSANGQAMLFTQPLTSQIRTVFWVTAESASATAAYRPLLGHASFNNDFIGEYGAPGDIWRSCCTSPRVIGGHTRLNGVPVDGTATLRPRTMSVISLVTTDVVSADRFGTDPGYSPWWGDLAELVIYNRALTDDEVLTVEDYLMSKYGLATTAGVPTTSSPGGMFTGSTSVSLSSATPCSEIHYTLDGSDPTQSSPLYAGSITITQTTTVKTRSFCPGLLPSDIATFGFTSSTDVSPLSMPGGNLLLWLRADAGVPNLNFGDFWGDQSGNGNNATQTSTLATPHLVQDVANGLPAMRFDGSANGQAMLFTQPLTGQIRTVFWVTAESASATAGYRPLLGHSSFNNDFIGDYGAPGDIWRSCCTSTQVRGGHTRLNGVPVDGTVTPRPRTLSVISLVTTDVVSADRFGTDPGYSPWWGDLAELVIYNRALTDDEVLTVEYYLMNKYGLAPQAAPPVASPSGGVLTGPATVSLTSATPCSEIHYTLDGSDPTETSLTYTAPITIGQTTTLKARSFCANLPPSDVGTFGFISSADFNPRSISGGNLLLWLRADAGVPNANFADFWADQSGNGNSAAQPSTNATPHLVQNAVNGLPTMRFDGSANGANGQAMLFTQPLTSEIRTVFWVTAESASATAAYRALLGHASFNNDFGGEYGAPGYIWRSCCTSTRVTGGQTRLNGVQIDGTSTPRPLTMSVISVVTTDIVSADRFGTDPGYSPWWGDLAELVIYNRALSSTEVHQVEQYLGGRYGIAVQ